MVIGYGSRILILQVQTLFRQYYYSIRYWEIPLLGKEYSQLAQNWSGHVLVVTLKVSRIVHRNHDIVGDIAIFVLYSA